VTTILAEVAPEPETIGEDSSDMFSCTIIGLDRKEYILKSALPKNGCISDLLTLIEKKFNIPIKSQMLCVTGALYSVIIYATDINTSDKFERFLLNPNENDKKNRIEILDIKSRIKV
jgi:hypothetical protein